MQMMDIIDESTGKVVGSVPNYTGEEILKMVDAAFAAQPAWVKVPLFERGQILYKFCDLIDRDRGRDCKLYVL